MKEREIKLQFDDCYLDKISQVSGRFTIKLVCFRETRTKVQERYEITLNDLHEFNLICLLRHLQSTVKEYLGQVKELSKKFGVSDS